MGIRKLARELLLAVAVAAAMVACAANLGPAAPKPDTVVYTAKAAYETALTGMVAYAKLPRCAPAAPALCSQQPILDQMEKARSAARITIDAAEGAVRTPGFGQDAVQTAVTAAEAATKALTAITATLPK